MRVRCADCLRLGEALWALNMGTFKVDVVGCSPCGVVSVFEGPSYRSLDTGTGCTLLPCLLASTAHPPYDGHGSNAPQPKYRLKEHHGFSFTYHGTIQSGEKGPAPPRHTPYLRQPQSDTLRHLATGRAGAHGGRLRSQQLSLLVQRNGHAGTPGAAPPKRAAVKTRCYRGNVFPGSADLAESSKRPAIFPSSGTACVDLASFLDTRLHLVVGTYVRA